MSTTVERVELPADPDRVETGDLASLRRTWFRLADEAGQRSEVFELLRRELAEAEAALHDPRPVSEADWLRLCVCRMKVDVLRPRIAGLSPGVANANDDANRARSQYEGAAQRYGVFLAYWEGRESTIPRDGNMVQRSDAEVRAQLRQLLGYDPGPRRTR